MAAKKPAKKSGPRPSPLDPRPKRGRPATGHQPQRQFRASDEEWEAWRLAAEARGTTRAEWMRATLNRAAGR